MILEIVERLIVQVQDPWAQNFDVCRFDVFEGTAEAKGLLLGHGSIDSVRPKYLAEPY